MNTRQHALQLMKLAGYHDDTAGFTRLLCENRIARQAADLAFFAGAQARKDGKRCECIACKRAHEAHEAQKEKQA